MSGYELGIKFAPIFTLERFEDDAWTRPNRTLYERHSLKFLPNKTTIPLLIDHQDDREIGTVHRLFEMDSVDGPWICASATATADAPSWLERGARCSFGFSALHRREIDLPGRRIEGLIARAIVNEISVLSPGKQPAEPCAEVLSFRRAAATSASSSPAVRDSSARGAAGEVIYGDGRLIRRYYATTITVR